MASDDAIHAEGIKRKQMVNENMKKFQKLFQTARKKNVSMILTPHGEAHRDFEELPKDDQD